MFKAGMQNWLANGRCKVMVPVGIHEICKRDQWALFTGTAGPNRKLVMWYYDANKTSVFTKIAFGPNSNQNLKQEQVALTWLNGQEHAHLQIPNIHTKNLDSFSQTDVDHGPQIKLKSIAEWPCEASKEWLLHPIQHCRLSTTPFYRKLSNSVHQIALIEDARIPQHFAIKMQQLLDGIKAEQSVAFAPAHGDCTAWNVHQTGHKLAMVDWELYLPEASALFDLFHFEYQGNILIGNKGFAVIRSAIDTALASEFWKANIARWKLDVAVLEQLYLLYNISYYLHIYHQQKDWHVQVNWLLKTWNDALSYWLQKTNSISPRKLLLQDVSVFLNQHPHAALKMKVNHIEELPEESDLDLCMPKAVAHQLKQLLTQHFLVAKVWVSKRSHMAQYTACLTDGSLLHIDAIWQFKRKSVDFLDVKEVLHSATETGAGLRQPHFVQDFLYTWLFYFLNNAVMPNRYMQAAMAASEPDQEYLLQHVALHTGIRLHSIADFEKVPAALYTATHAWIKSKKANSGYKKIMNHMYYLSDVVRHVFRKKGMVITFSGVDGAGKSTVIEATRQRIEKVLRRKVVVLRHRPSLLPILSAWKYGKAAAEQKAATTLPRQGSNKSSIGSLLRFSYYYSDYLLGQFYIHVKYVWRGYVVLYDRYYFDFINDGMRSNIRLPKAFSAAGYRLLLKPKLNFFLYASAAEILERKQELNAETIEQLTGEYMHLFNNLNGRYQRSKYWPLHNRHLDETLGFVFQQIQKIA